MHVAFLLATYGKSKKWYQYVRQYIQKNINYIIWFYVNIIISKNKDNKNIYLLDNKYIYNNTIKSYWSPKNSLGLNEPWCGSSTQV